MRKRSVQARSGNLIDLSNELFLSFQSTKMIGSVEPEIGIGDNRG